MRNTSPDVDCPTEVLDWIAWYPEGRLPEAIRGAIESHAAECAPCRDEIGLLSDSRAAAPIPAADPERVFERVRQRIASESAAPAAVPVARPPLWTGARARRAALAAGVSLALFVAGAVGWAAHGLWSGRAAEAAADGSD